MKKALLGAALALGLAGQANADYVYVGEWFVGDGPIWTSNPTVYSAQEAAALLFGGVASDYAISTAGIDPNLVNHLAHVDGWGDNTYLTATVAESYKLDAGGLGYNNPGGGGTAYSAYVLDHSCFNRYSNLNLKCGANEPGKNYAFREAKVPEPSTLALMGISLVGLAALRRRKQQD